MKQTPRSYRLPQARLRRDPVGPDLGRCELPALTSIRALLAWWVVAYHFLPTAPFLIGPDNLLVAKGRLAVDCFFVLSGFVLCHVHPVIIGAGQRYPVANFLLSRLARIYPLHLVMLAAFAAVVIAYRSVHGAQHGAFASDTAAALVKQILLLHGWFGSNTQAWNVPSWSISSEWAAYLLAPLIFLAASRMRPAHLLAALAGLLAVTLGLAESGAMFHPGMGLARVLLEFCIGAGARTMLTRGAGGLVPIRTPGLLCGWAIAAAAAGSAHQGLFLLAMLWVMLLLALRTRRAIGWLGRLERVAIYLGETSFAVYMCHALVLMFWSGLIEPHLQTLRIGNPVVCALGLIVVIQGLASALHHGVELPAQRRIREIARGLLAARPYSAASANVSIGGQEQTRLRSP